MKNYLFCQYDSLPILLQNFKLKIGIAFKVVVGAIFKPDAIRFNATLIEVNGVCLSGGHA